MIGTWSQAPGPALEDSPTCSPSPDMHSFPKFRAHTRAGLGPGDTVMARPTGGIHRPRGEPEEQLSNSSISMGLTERMAGPQKKQREQHLFPNGETQEGHPGAVASERTW